MKGSLTGTTLLMWLLLSVSPVCPQDALGTNMGIPNSSPPILWPRGMSIEALSPAFLYPNGPQFPLGNTSGGFGTSGTGPISGVGLAQRAVSPLVQTEFIRPFSFVQGLTLLESVEALRGGTIFSSVLSIQFRYEVGKTGNRAEDVKGLITPYALPSVDSILQDRPATTDSILRTAL